jgi:carboxypeptidase C (cathepsin A)
MGYPGASDELVQALVLLPDLRVLIVHGYHDLVTTWYATRWVIDHEPMPDSVRERIEWLLLPGGHMPYLRREGLERLDVRAESFYRLALGRTRPARP